MAARALTSLALSAACALAPLPASADRKPVSDRWTAELDPEHVVTYDSYYCDSVAIAIAGEDVDVARLHETGSIGPVGDTLESVPDDFRRTWARYLPSGRCHVGSVAGSVRWLDCEHRSPLPEAEALVEHSDGRLLLVRLVRDEPRLRALVESFRPREPENPCGETCDLGAVSWLTFRAQGAAPLARVPRQGEASWCSSIFEVAPPNARELSLHYYHQPHNWAREPQHPFSRKVTILGEPYPAYARDEHSLTIYLGGPVGLTASFELWGRTAADLDRCIDMVQTATPGPEWSAELELLPRFTRENKLDFGHRGGTEWAWPRVFGGTLVTLVVLGGIVLARRRRLHRESR